MSKSTQIQTADHAGRRLDRTGNHVTFGWMLVFALVAIAFMLRVWQLDETPPYLWWDEASQGLDGRELLAGVVRIFYPRALGKEPLYIYLTAPFIATWDGTPLATRLTGALTGALTAAALYAAGRALWRTRPTVGFWTGLFAAVLWTVNYWPQSINRIGFQVNTFPLVLTVAVTAWLNWTYRPGRTRGIFFGLMAGLTLYTYLAARITPALWLLLYLGLTGQQRSRLRPTLPVAGVTFMLVAIPLSGYFLANPGQFGSRTGTIGGLTNNTLLAMFRGMLAESWLVLQLFLGFDGDPLLRHNIPHRTPFLPWLAVLFISGVMLALWALRRTDAQEHQRALTLLLWWAVLCIPAVLAGEDNPHFTRLFGALPPALLLAGSVPALGLSRFVRSSSRRVHFGLALVLLLLTVEGSLTVRTYFTVWRHDPDLYIWFQGDYWDAGEHARQDGDTTVLVPLTAEPYIFQYAFADTTIVAVPPTSPSLEATLAAAVTTPNLDVVLWDTGVEEQADLRHIATFYARREGVADSEFSLRRNTITRYRLGPAPDFAARGQQIPVDRQFARGVTLVDARIGAAFPNLQRSGSQLLPGTDVWAILSWRLEQPVRTVRVATDLVDSEGHKLAPSDEWLLPEEIQAWSPGAVVQTVHMLTVPDTQPPGPVHLDVRLYDDNTLQPLMPEGSDATAVPLHELIVLPAEGDDAAFTPPVKMHVQVAPGLLLVGHEPLPQVQLAGLPLKAKFYLMASEATLPPTITVALDNTSGRSVVALPQNAASGRPFHLFADILVPAETPSGEYMLAIRVPRVDGRGRQVADGADAAIGPVTVEGRAHLFDLPDLTYPLQSRVEGVAALTGIIAKNPLSAEPGDNLSLIFVWRAFATADRDWVRFVHLLDADGTLVAQNDAAPCGGACRPRSWLPGEYLRDTVTLGLPADLQSGNYTLAVGWYDPATLERAPVAGPDVPTANGNMIRVPVPVMIPDAR